MRIGLVLGIMCGLTSPLWAREISYTLEDRDRLIRIETSLNEFKEAVDKRFEQVDKRFDDVHKSIDQMLTFIWILAGIFGALVAVTIGFAIWDRRTALSPAIKRSNELEERQARLERVLKEWAQKEPTIAEILRQAGLL